MTLTDSFALPSYSKTMEGNRNEPSPSRLVLTSGDLYMMSMEGSHQSTGPAFHRTKNFTYLAA